MDTIYKYKDYTHFDLRIKLENRKLPLDYLNKVENKNWVVKHGFYPFVQYTQKKYKFSSNKSEATDKSRTIMYCSHIDRYIYQFYASKLNGLYNNKVKEMGIAKEPIAYRKNIGKKNSNNIGFAKEVFDFISSTTSCVIYVTDFEKYFDRIDHALLKRQVEYILTVDRLPEDFYKVFLSVTKYCFSRYDDIIEFLKLKNPKITKKDLKRQVKFFDDDDEFHNFKKGYNSLQKKNLQLNMNSYGIPQGSPISAVLSNIYLLDFDKGIATFVDKKNGLYRRYCDDVIIIVPLKETNEIEKETENVIDAIKTCVEYHKANIPNLAISEAKTHIYRYKDGSVKKADNNKNGHEELTFVDYLGFTFNGKIIKIREKSITNYYRKLNKRIKSLNLYSNRYDRNVYLRKFYKQYTHLGANEKGLSKKGKKRHGNFITYAKRANDVFGEQSGISNQIKNHWRIIHKKLIKKKG